MNRITLTQGKFALVDNEDFEYLSQWKWLCGSRGYAFRCGNANGKRINIWMHRLVANTPEGLQTDHINGNRLDNCRENLRIVTNIQNGQNQKKRRIGNSGYRGVTLNKSTGKWQSQIQVFGNKLYLGLFDTKEDAATAYSEASKKHRGELA